MIILDARGRMDFRNCGPRGSGVPKAGRHRHHPWIWRLGRVQSPGSPGRAVTAESRPGLYRGPLGGLGWTVAAESAGQELPRKPGDIQKQA
jgi:hypothetical protein